MSGSRRVPGSVSEYRVGVPFDVDARQLQMFLAEVADRAKALEAPSFEEFAPRFIREHAQANRQKPSGIADKESILRTHLLPRFRGKRLSEISDIDVTRLKADLRCSAKRVNNILSVLNRMLRCAVRWGVLARMPVQVDFLKTAAPDVAFYEEDEYRRLVEGAKENAQIAAMVLLGGEAGLRMGEMMALDWTDLDFRRTTLHVRKSDSYGRITTPKGGKPRTVPMTQLLREALERAKHDLSPRVLHRGDGKPCSRQNLRTWMNRAQRAAGLTETGALHILRHTFCSHLAMRGAAPLAIQKLAGHTSLRTTQRYMHLAPSEATRAIELLDARRHDGTPSSPTANAVSPTGFEPVLGRTQGKNARLAKKRSSLSRRETRCAPVVDALALLSAELEAARDGGRDGDDET